MPVGLFGLAGDLLLADSNCDVHEKAVAQSSEVNNFGTSVVLHREKNVRQETIRINDRKPVRAEPIQLSEIHFSE